MPSSDPRAGLPFFDHVFADEAARDRAGAGRASHDPAANQPAGDPSPRRGRNARRLGVLGAVGVVGAALISAVAPASIASADPSANSWYRLRMCESGNNYQINTGNAHYGAYQFDLSTWRGVGGAGYPNQASATEQDRRALILYRERGWQPWQCASIVGLREDADARSGRTSDIHPPQAVPAPTPPVTRPAPRPAPPAPQAGGVPAWPNTQYWSIGDNSPTIARWQAQMHHRGAGIVGNGDFGPNTLVVVKRIQGQNHLPQTGLLGPVTWRLAWRGSYHNAAPAPRPTTSGAPAWPNTQYWSIGDNSPTIARWQAQMHHRGAGIVGDGDFGPNTQKVVNRVQRLNHLPQTGLLGPVTWRLAWTGRY